MTEQAPQPKENFLVQLKNRVAEIKNDAVTSWKSMDAKDAIKTYLGGGALAVLGILTTVAGRKADLWPIEGLGYTYSFLGASGMLGGYIKLVELGIKEHVAIAKAKLTKGK